MRLKKIKLAGFKSFVDPTSIPFPDDMTAIVGPNGCGKSNVIDAVRWVLGESSAKNLRGDAMTDVIFNGSSARKPVSQCSVELVFDNSSGRIQGEYAGYNELSVKRLVTREALSHYFLNGSKCRRRDVTDLFLGTGLGPRSYAIIEQGMISRLIESKPQELRVFIEEAAGISKYKERRRETENRIRHSRDNLERLEDVRDELGKQLDKLQRQAAAAKRYKQLKADERKFTAQLTALRWLRQNQHVSELEQQISEHENKIESLISRQRGDEKGMVEYQQRQQDLKQRLSDIQNQVFQVGNEITRLEQTQIHARQRQQQIDQQLSRLEQEIGDSETHLAQEQQALDKLTSQLEDKEPELTLLQEQSEQAQEQLADAEQHSAGQQSAWRAQEQQYYQIRQQCQSQQTRIEGQQAMIGRAEQRLRELQDELNRFESSDYEPQSEHIAEALTDKQQAFDQLNQTCEQSFEQHQQQLHKVQQLQQQLLQLNGDIQQGEGKLASLKTLQQSTQEQDRELQQWLESQPELPQPVWQSLKAEPGWEKALESALQNWLSVPVLDGTQPPAMPGSQWLLKQHMITDKPAGTLAAKVQSAQLPSFLLCIGVVEDDTQMENRRLSLQPGQSLINAEGMWYGCDWQIQGSTRSQTGMLDRAADIQRLQQSLQQQHQQMEELEQQLQQAKEQQAQRADLDAQNQQQLRQLEREVMQLEQQKTAIQRQQEAKQEQTQRLNQQIRAQQDQLEQDRQDLELQLAEQQELQIQLEGQQSEHQQTQAQQEGLQQQLSQLRAQAERLRSHEHELALQVQGLSNQKENARQAIDRHRHRLDDKQQDRQRLSEEKHQWQQPEEEQSGQLQILLEQRVELEGQQRELAEKLNEVDEYLHQAQSGQQQIQEQINQLREAQQSLQLECEGCRVRASGFIEQLQQMQQNVKEVLDELDEDADESQWQQELDKISAAVGRLGAVNLAAVEEFEVQAERKKHLDDQYQDLTDALETLDNAIRKIDRETRSRFRDTFERVNEDLKTLFPKVFGGGSAYLELTDDDLLETGVTIMARPPGKKNSTIHLLSGGEKALTALSLVFAIFRLNPAPFCLLDEVDAPLDDANVGRFCNLVSEMSNTVQFIYITHNKIAMEMAKHLTGVTMAEPGVSRMVAVDVDEAVALAEL
ncbi:chromosome segregation protein SMC [Lacimicrobium alkaliphilum]|uniref:Chromosome partition protein Smc n=1 Tax=Lacimicrobium alkaliphilum TaxID=1526571 RepID=A0ABQ1R570_9ALTE|nr:chromosome segregation protein SMC [Lacimicrobium alkaliphilum]GGD54395.1 chromosome partition protein Smc [Lacimicrobium alkaliphilum]